MFTPRASVISQDPSWGNIGASICSELAAIRAGAFNSSETRKAKRLTTEISVDTRVR